MTLGRVRFWALTRAEHGNKQGGIISLAELLQERFDLVLSSESY